ncbi:MAG: TlpA disulfide reductase family protein [Bacteroidota bacterium]
MKEKSSDSLFIYYNSFDYFDENRYDTCLVADDGTFEFLLEAPDVISLNIINRGKTISNVAILASITGEDVTVNFELKDSVVISKKFKGDNSENMAFADKELYELLIEGNATIEKYTYLNKQERDSLMPDTRDNFKKLLQKSHDRFISEQSPFKKQIYCFKNIYYAYDIGTLDYYDDVKTTLGNNISTEDILNTIPATSPLWQTNFQLPIMMLSQYKFPFSVQGYSDILKNNIDYLRTLIAEHQNSNVAGYTIIFSISTFTLSNDTVLVEEFHNYYNARDNYSEMVSMSYENSFSPDRAIKIGNQLPEFEFASINDSTVIYTNESFKDKIYLIDFWATWCKPCMKEMPFHHEAYEKYKESGFDILSVSLDASPNLVRNFRKNEWLMPWNHTVLTDGKNAPYAKRFEAQFIPKMILVDGKTNTIISESFYMKDGALEKELVKYINH